MRKDEKNGLHKEKTRTIPRKIVGSRPQNEARREKSGLHRAKNEDDPSKNRPKTGSKWGKVGKTEISGRKSWSGGEVKKKALLPILQCYEVAK